MASGESIPSPMINTGTAGISGLSVTSSGTNSFFQTKRNGGKLEGISTGIVSSGEFSATWGASCAGGASTIGVSCSGVVSFVIGIGDSIGGDDGGGFGREGSSMAGGFGVVSLTFGVPAQE